MKNSSERKTKGFFNQVLASAIGFVLGNFMFFGSIFILIIVISVIGSIFDSSEKIEPNTIVKMKFDYTITDKPNTDPFMNFNLLSEFEPNNSKHLYSVLRSIKTAGDNENISGMLLDLRGFQSPGMASIKEIRDALREFKQKGKFIYARPNFGYTDNTLFTSIKSSTSDFLNNSGYKTSELGFSLGTKFEQFQNIYLSPEIDFLIEDLETSSKASNLIKKQEGSYTDLYFNYSINQDLRDKKFRTEDGFVTTFSQELPVISDSSEISNSFDITKFKKLSTRSDIVGKISFFGKTITGLSDDVRISKRLYIPSSRLRGFEKGKVGPVDSNDFIGGNHLTSVNMSATLPNILEGLDNLDVGVFFDAANTGWPVEWRACSI